jgi:hypothetical protein
MKILILLTVTTLFVFATNAQVLYSNGATLTLKTGGILLVNGNVQFESGSIFNNDGSITITGNVINNNTMSAANGGTLTLSGSSVQTLSGTATYFAKDVVVNNAAGITINTPMKVDGVFNFTNGIVTATATANAVTFVTFTATGTVSNTNTAKDASHIKGYVIKEGTGSFTFPVGDGTKFKKVDVNTSAKAKGMRVKYNAVDAGAAPFTTGGTELVALTSYNNQEYWEITPNSTATGAVTVYWDGYKDSYPNAVNQRKVAHLKGGNWLNEGTIGTGTTTAGSVTSNAIDTWSPFTFGNITSILPLRWLSITGNLNNQKQATLNWQVQENNVVNYSIEKSNDAVNFTGIANLISKGNGTNNYNFTDATTLSGTVYYRIKQTDRDARTSYSSIIKLSNNQNNTLTIYPNPVKNMVSFSGATIGSIAILTDINGKTLQEIKITQSAFIIDMSKYSSGLYVLKTNNGVTQKIIKQ